MRRLALAAAIILAFAGMARAQTPNIPPPAPYSPVDARGINLFSGEFTYASPSISVGTAEGGLSYTATYDTAINYWRHSVWGGVHRTPVLPGPSQAPIWSVTVMGDSAVFSEDGSGGYQIVEGDGALTETAGTFAYTALDGTVAVFGGPSTFNRYLANAGLITSLTRPNGEVLNWTYNTDTLIQSVVSNRGYQLQFNYTTVASAPAIVITALNNAIDACSPTAASCTFSQTWPSLTLSQTGSGASPTERQITDSLNRTTRLFTPAGSLTGVRRPTATSGQSISLGRQINPIRYTTYDDGEGTWRYIYDIPPTPPFPPAEETYTTTVRSPLLDNTVVEIRSVESTEIIGISDYRQVRVVSVTDPLLNETTYAHNLVGALARVTHPEGNIDRYGYTFRGDLETATRDPKPGSPLSSTTTTAVYGDCSTPIRCGRPTAIIDARGAQTDYAYDAAGNLTTATDPAPTVGAVRPQARQAYAQRYAWYRQNGAATITQAASPIWVRTGTSDCAVGSAPACVGTVNEVVTATTYQTGSASAASNLLPLSVTAGAGNGSLTASTSTTYDAVGNVRTVNGPLSGTADTTWFFTDAMRQPLGAIAPDPDGAGSRPFPATSTVYNADGQPTSVRTGTATAQSDAAFAAMTVLQRVDSLYDAQARKVRDTAVGGSTTTGVTQYAYDDAGRPTCTAVRMNPTTFPSLPASACTLTTAGTFGPDRVGFNTYDDADRLLTTQTGYGTPDVRTALTQTWTANGQVDWVEDANGNRSDYVYDGFDRLAELQYPSTTTDHTPNPADNVVYGYDANDNPTTRLTRNDQLFTTTFDALNRPTGIAAPTNVGNTSYTYDLLDRRLTATLSSTAATVTTGWDALGRLTSETGPLGTFSMQYDLAGRRTRMDWPGSPVFYVTYDWNLDNQMAAVRQSGTTQILGFRYDSLGRRDRLTRGSGGVTTSYGYDAASRLAAQSENFSGSAWDQTWEFTYNPAGQAVTRTSTNGLYSWSASAGSVTYPINGLNQTGVNGAALPYDLKGNLLGDSVRGFTYDQANKLRTVFPVGGSTTGTLTYDALDRLSILTGTQGATYAYAGSGEIAALANTGSALNNRFVRGPNVDELLVSYSGTSGTLAPVWWINDPQGSPISIAQPDGTTGAIWTYDEYGQRGASNGLRTQYTGQLWLPDFGVYHYKARAYHPGLGRFMQTDPIGYGDGLNLYGYVANDPVNATDPTGMSCEKVGEQYACKVDGVNGPLSDQDRQNIYNFSGDYTAVVNALMADPARQASATMTLADGSITTVSVTAGEIGGELIRRQVVADTSSSGVDATGAITYAETESAYRPEVTTVTQAGLRSDGAFRRGLIVHEGIHGSTGERTAFPPGTRDQLSDTRHNSPFQSLVNRLLGRRQ